MFMKEKYYTYERPQKYHKIEIVVNNLIACYNMYYTNKTTNEIKEMGEIYD